MSRYHISQAHRQFIILCAGILSSFLLSSLLWKYFTNFCPIPGNVVQYYTPAQKSCREDRHVVFMKVPKCGSTTLQNIFFRFGMSRDLMFMLPQRNNWLSKNRIIHVSDIFPNQPGQPFDVLCNHVRYNRTDLVRFLHNDTSRIAIIREPGSHLRSYLYYYHATYLIMQRSPETDIVQKYLKHPKVHATKILSNPVSDWFSILPSGNNTDKAMQSFKDSLYNLDKDFKLMLIMERMDESLVLMKRLLCWNMEDIIYIPRNVNRLYPREDLNAADKIRHEHIARYDYVLYDYFSAKFNSIVDHSGEDFQDEVRFFKKILKSVQEFCTNWRRKIGTSLHIDPSPWNQGFTVSSMSCLLLTYSELELQNYVGLWQYGKLWATIHRN